ncbi:M81 family metallopeptidase [Deinococcus sonorensis]|uniref:M81 family metallopeptidase n=2 Tax=Deinococcus sonorensis TaxID=309891 RepID=A0AAU7U502_9DEIO
MRIAVGGIHTECSTYNPVLAGADQFTVVRGSELLAHPNFQFLQAFPGEVRPVLHARAIPGGPVEHATYQAFKAEFLDGLRAALPLDGVYLAMHGALFVDGLLDAEGDWISATRAVVGEDCLISASYDLHGNVSQRIVDQLDLFTAYRTAPHIDVIETQRRAFELLVGSLQQQRRPGVVWVPVPVLLPGERTSTEDQPAAGLYADLDALSAQPGVLDVSLLVGYVWADEPRATASVVVTGMDRGEMERLASQVAQRYWDARNDFSFGSQSGSITECVRWAAESRTQPVILADSGDNPTGGGVGDRADVLREVLAQGLTGVVVAAITDEAAVDRCFAAGVGAEVTLRVGGTLDPSSVPVDVHGTVQHLCGVGPDREAVVQGAGVQLALAARRRPYHNLSDFQRLQLQPEDARVIVVKSGYLSPELAPLANPSLLALSPGVVDQDIPRLKRTQTQRPTFPFNADFEWAPAPRPSARMDRQP